jgi:hypothetical protein
MVDQTIAKPLGLIKDLKILVHGIPYGMTFIVIQNSVLDSKNFMLLGCPWLRDAKMIGATTLSLYKELVQLEPYLLLKNLEHQPNI